MSEATIERAAMGGRGVLEGAFALLEVLAEGDEVGLTQLASAAGLPKATAYRLLNQLVVEGAVQRRSGRYQIGPRVYRLGQTWQPARLLRAASARPLGQLTAASDRGGFSLAVTDRGHTMLIGGIGREIDEIFPLRAGVLLPPGTAAEQALALGRTVTTPPTGYSQREWSRQLAVTRERGLAYDTDMTRFGLACVAAPVRGPSGEVVAALAATVADLPRVPAVAEAVLRAAGLVSANLTRLLRSTGAMSL
ncbi:helix-turn-helix domain-containing protein [Nocardia brasiliensis]|uniref:helix-turn-helix domain-containing protein n=1 Tax=Nocardia brasiliensis TaxID=37326 RepID=UPI0004A7370E|nr:helix-turn-helix domain-containing protein [Nocardia brasiliensis]MBF6127624.1 helix-turn-helix domain-containing protein [Nocardia brasiliensis]MBF6548008.1 helix-turn-helix domain-containing protein [Nocardia brasiliensis]